MQNKTSVELEREARELERYYKPSELVEALQIYIACRLPAIIKSAPGCGKSSIVAQVAYQLGYKLIIAHPVIDDPIDYKGFPCVVNGKAVFLPYSNLEKIMSATEPTIYFLDDLGQAAPAVQKPCMQLLLAREINGIPVSKHVTFLAATNRKIDKAGVSGLLEPVKSRFGGILGLLVDVYEWGEWALDKGLPIELIAYSRFAPQMLMNFQPTLDLENSACPRTWEHVGVLQNKGIPEHLRFRMFADAAGTDFSYGYTAFLKNFDRLINLDDVFRSPETAEIPRENDVLYAVCAALIRKADRKNIAPVLKYAERLQDEFHVFLGKGASKQPKVRQTNAYIEWRTRNNKLFGGGNKSFGDLFAA